MNLKKWAGFVVFLALGVVLTSSVSARAGEGKEDCKDTEHHDHDVKTPVNLIGLIPVPGDNQSLKPRRHSLRREVPCFHCNLSRTGLQRLCQNQLQANQREEETPLPLKLCRGSETLVS